MKGTIHIHLRLDKILKNGKVPIELVYSVRNQRKYYNTGEKVYPVYWDKGAQRAFYLPVRDAKKKLPNVHADLLLTEVEVSDINSTLKDIIREIDIIEGDFVKKNTPFSSQMVMQELKADRSINLKREEDKSFIFDFMDKYIKDHENSRERGSLGVYKSVKNHLLAFQQATNRRITFEAIDYGFFRDFQSFLIDRVKTNKDGEILKDADGEPIRLLNSITIAKALSTLKTFLGYAGKQEIKVNDNYRKFTITKDKGLEVIALTEEELQSIIDLDLDHNKRLDQVKSVFLFSCATALRFSDLKGLKRANIKKSEIVITVKKTKEFLSIPLNSLSSSILDKYKHLPTPLPVISNQKLNEYLKEVCALAQINEIISIVRYRGGKRVEVQYPKYELISIHNGRKTWATLSLERGMTAEQAMKIGGWDDVKSFKRYVEVSNKQKQAAMDKAWGEVPKMKVV